MVAGGRADDGRGVLGIDPAAGPEQRTPDLAAVLQEIVDHPGWAAGNALAILITGSGERVAESYNGLPAAAPLLHVEYRVSRP